MRRTIVILFALFAISVIPVVASAKTASTPGVRLVVTAKLVNGKVLKLKGKEHKLKPISVRDYIVNVRAAEALSKETDAGLHLEALVKLVTRLFPTLSEDDVNDLTVPQLEKILEFSKPDEAGNAAGEPEAAAK